jgi:two-component system, cell cycle response regulator DivK
MLAHSPADCSQSPLAYGYPEAGTFRTMGSGLFQVEQHRGGTMASGITRPRAAHKVLIVEDNELNMKLFNDLLEAQGYTTLKAKDGPEALRIVRLHRPDLVLLDIQLPEVSGLEVAKRLKEDEELRSIPVIAVTAFAMKQDEDKIRQAGCEGYMTKPISIVGFLQAIEHHLSDAI